MFKYNLFQVTNGYLLWVLIRVYQGRFVSFDAYSQGTDVEEIMIGKQ